MHMGVDINVANTDVVIFRKQLLLQHFQVDPASLHCQIDGQRFKSVEQYNDLGLILTDS